MAFNLFGKKNDCGNVFPAMSQRTKRTSCVLKRSIEETASGRTKKARWSSKSARKGLRVATIALARKYIPLKKKFNIQKCREEVLSNCFANCGKPVYAREFSKDIKILALAFQRTNVEAYKFLCQMALPSNRQISRTLPFTCGISAAVLRSISMQLPRMEKNDKLCSLVLDDISLTKRIDYSSSSDCFEGFVDIHGGRCSKFAECALVLMACGVMSSWKQPVCLYFTDLMNEESIVRAIEDCISSLLAVGLNVVAVVSNIKDCTISAVETLAKRSFPEGDGHCMKFGANKVFHFLDPWLIQEQIRDSCIKYNIKFKGKNGEMNTTKIDTLMEFFDKLKVDKSLAFVSTFLPKLVGPETRKTESNSRNEVYFTGMFKDPNFMRIIVFFEPFCSKTQNVEGLLLAEFIIMISSVFDVFYTDQNKADGPYRSMITSKSIHHKFLKQMLVVDEFEFLPLSPNNEEPDNKCFKFLKRNIVVLQSLWQMLHEQGFEKLQTDHLNLGPLLNFFNTFKEKSNNCKSSLSCKAFMESFKLLVIESSLVDMAEADWVDCEDFNYLDDDDESDDEDMKKHDINMKLFAEFMNHRPCDKKSRLEFQNGVNVEDPSSSVQKCQRSMLHLCTEWCDDFTNEIDQEKVLARATNLCSSFLHTFYLSKPIYSCFSCFQIAIHCQCSNSDAVSAKSICRKCKNPNLPFAKQMYQTYLKILQNLRMIGYMPDLVSTLKLQFSADLKRSVECEKHKDMLGDNILEFIAKEAMGYFSKRVNSCLLSIASK